MTTYKLSIIKFYLSFQKRMQVFDDDLRVQERQQVKDQQPCISVFAAYLAIPSSN